MIKVIEQGQTRFTRVCDRCGCKFQYDLSDLCGLDFIPCPCCHTSLTHVGPKAIKIDLNKTNRTDSDSVNWDEIRKYTTPTQYKFEVGDGKYNYATTTSGEYVNPNTTITITANEITEPSTLTGENPNTTTYANKLPDDIVDDPYNKIGNDLPDDIDGDLPDVVEDDCSYTSERFKEWHDNWVKIMKENAAIECKNKK